MLDTPFTLWDPESARPVPGIAGIDTAGAIPGDGVGVPLSAYVGGMGVGGVDPATATTTLSVVDVLFSQWFLDRDLIRLLFREKPASGFSRGEHHSTVRALGPLCAFEPWILLMTRFSRNQC